MTTNEKISKLRNLMNEGKIDAYIVPSPDYHQSEYVAEHFKARHFMSGFTGYAGTLVVSADESVLWTDGRYFTQAEIQLTGSEVKLFKMNESGVPNILQYLRTKLQENACLAFDGRTIALGQGKDFEKLLAEKKGNIKYNLDLVGRIWNDRPSLPCTSVFIHDLKYCGESCASKLSRLRDAMQKAGANKHILLTLDDIAWLLNIRGADVSFVPLTLCYAIISHNDVQLFIDEAKLSADVKAYLNEHNVKVNAYNEIYETVKTFSESDTVLLDPERINYSLYSSITKSVPIIEAQNPTVMFKAVKNATQIEHIKNTYVKESVAFTKFIYWVKTNIGKVPMTEISAAEQLINFRKEQEGYQGESFHPISGYAEHGAIIHYRATEETNKALQPENLYLIDSGGQYFDGTTDTTRTLVLGAIIADQKKHYTAVLKAAINLSMVKFLYGCKGSQIDMAARAPMWALALDYKHGTGHGIGQFLGVHEGPARIVWNYPDPKNETVLEAGMLLSNEPGFYIKGEYGIRLENTILITKAEENEFGQFLCMDTITFIPFDRDAIDPSLLSPAEKEYLNAYHQKVYDRISPYLTSDEKNWLKAQTAKV